MFRLFADRLPRLVAGGLALALASCESLPPPPPPPTYSVELEQDESVRLAELQYAHELDSWMPALAAPQVTDRADAQQALADLVQQLGQPGRDAERAGLAKAIAARIGATTPHVARLFLIQQLAFIAGEETVPALRAALDSPNTRIRDNARRALERTAAPQAGAALRQALRQTDDPAWQQALIRSLAARRDHAAIAVLNDLAKAPDPITAAAAIEALGTLDGPEVIRALREHLTGAPRPRRTAAAAALLHVAQRLQAAGHAQAAAPLYEDVHDHATAGALERGALVGLAETQGVAALPRLVTTTRITTDPVTRRVALRLIAGVPSEAATAFLIETAAEASAPEQLVFLLDLLSEQPAERVHPTVRSYLDHDAAEVRAAAATALAQVGGAADVPALLKRVATDQRQVRSAALDTLSTLEGLAVEQALLQRLQPGGDPQVTVAAAEAATARSLTRATRPLLRLTDLAEPARVRAAAFIALGTLAGPDDVNTLIARLLEQDDERVLSAAGEATVTLLNRLPTADRVEPVVNAYGRADPAARVALLEVLGRLAGPRALATVRAALDSENLDVRLAALRALARQQEPAVIDDLLQAAESAPDQRSQVLALRSLAQVLEQVELPDVERLGVIKAAWPLAPRASERRLLLNTLGDVADPEALAFAHDALDDPELQNEAAVAIAQVAQAIAGWHRDAGRAALTAAAERELAPPAAETVAQALETLNEHQGYIGAWLYAGPYQRPGASALALLDVVLPPEESDAVDVDWQPLRASIPDNPWQFDFTQIAGGGDRAIYVRTYIDVPAATPVRFALGSDDGAAVFLNDELIHQNPVLRGLTPAEDQFEAELHAGRNELLIKVIQGGGGWGLICAVTAPDGQPLENAIIWPYPQEIRHGQPRTD